MVRHTFCRELIDENDLGEEDMEAFAGMTMEQIAKEITDRALYGAQGG